MWRMLILCVLCLLVTGTQSRPQKQPRVVSAPSSYYKAEAFVELGEADREMYSAGLMDGFYASALFGASDETVNNLISCTKDMDSKQVTAIITKYVKDHPETWHLPLSADAHNALNKACPGGLRIIGAKN